LAISWPSRLKNRSVRASAPFSSLDAYRGPSALTWQFARCDPLSCAKPCQSVSPIAVGLSLIAKYRGTFPVFPPRCISRVQGPLASARFAPVRFASERCALVRFTLGQVRRW
jgi:hypothetical protein